MGRDDTEAAYFTLLRARETVTDLQRFGEFLHAERARMARWTSEQRELEDQVTSRLRRTLRHTDQLMADVLKTRETVIAEELARLPDRIAAAEEHVRECEDEHDRLRRAS